MTTRDCTTHGASEQPRRSELSEGVAPSALAPDGISRPLKKSSHDYACFVMTFEARMGCTIT